MNTIRILLFAIVTLFLQAESEAAVKILKIHGDDVTFSANKGRTFKKLKTASAIKEGTIVKVGENSYVDIQLEEKILLRVSEGSKLEIERARTSADQDRDVRLSCLEGEFVCASPVLTAKSRIEIKTTTGVCAGRGDTPEFEADAAGRIRCYAGTVVVVYVHTTMAPAIVLGPGDKSTPLSNFTGKWVEKINEKELATLAEKVSDLKKSMNDYKIPSKHED